MIKLFKILILLCTGVTSITVFASMQYAAGTSRDYYGQASVTSVTSTGPAYGSYNNSALIINRSLTLKSSDVIFHFDNIDTASNGGGIWCDKDVGGSDKITFHIRPTTGMVAFGSAPGNPNATLYKTSIQGLYYTVQIKNFAGAYTTFTNSTFFLTSDVTTKVNSNSYSCGTAGAYMGGFTLSVEIEFYTDSTLILPDEDAMGNRPVIGLQPSGNLAGFFSIQNEEEGGSVGVSLSTGGLRIAYPTCFSVLSSTSANTLDLGTYTISELKTNTREVPFSINLASCMGVKNIEVRLFTPLVDNHNEMLLGNSYEGQNGGAAGLGVQITGESTTLSPKMVLQPNMATSVYRDYEVETPAQFPIFYSAGNPNESTSQTLNFSALLKPDGGAIEPGNFKATGVFSITYP